MMRDKDRTVFNFVLQPEAIAIKETKRAISELEKLDIHSFELIINGVIPTEAQSNPLFSARAKMQTNYLDQINRDFTYPRKQMRLLSGEISGVKRLREVSRIYFDGEMEKETKVIMLEGKIARKTEPLNSSLYS